MSVNIFQVIKERVSLRELVKFYGLDVDRGGFACCPFHNERNPSFKVYEDHYHCFGCGEHGDHVDFVQKLYGITNIEAAKKISHDLGLGLEQGNFAVPEKRRPAINNDISVWRNDSLKILTEYKKLLEKWSEVYVPRSPIDKIDERYIESIHEQGCVDYYIETLILGSKDEIQELYENDREYPVKIKKRLDSLDTVSRNSFKRAI